MFHPLIFSLYGTLNRNIYAKIWPVLLIETVRLGVRAFGAFQKQYSKSVHKPNKACSYFFMYLQKNSIDMYWDPYEYSKQRLIKMKELHSKWGAVLEFRGSVSCYIELEMIWWIFRCRTYSVVSIKHTVHLTVHGYDFHFVQYV